MGLKKEIQYLAWVSRHRKDLQKLEGRWVGIKLGKGVIAAGKSLKKVRRDFLKQYPHELPHLFQVPPKGQRFYILTLLLT